MRLVVALALVGLAFAAPPAEAAGPEVAIFGCGLALFLPHEITVAPGTVVTWTNGDVCGAPHTATSVDRDWTTDHLDPGASASVKFDAPGDYAYVCSYHVWMTGRVVVEP